MRWLLVLLFAGAGAGQSAAQERADTARLRQHVRQLAAAPRVAGAATHAASAGYVLEVMARAGLDTSRTAFRAFVPHPVGTPVLERVDKFPGRVPVAEVRVADDSVTYQGIWPTFVAYAYPGTAEGPLLFLNRGAPADYATLDSLHVPVRGAIVLVRAGRRSPLNVVQEAERRGVAGVVFYADPQDDGYVRGDFYPDGRMRHPDAMPRFSLNPGLGDPTAPRGLADSSRTGDEAAVGVPRIPAMSIGYSHATQLLSLLRSVDVPQAWQGGLPFRYHVGLNDLVVRIHTPRELGAAGVKELVNTLGVIPGSDGGRQVVVIGARRDAFGFGASDNATGVASLLEVARVLGAARAAGWTPRHTVILATWDGGVWGQIGSSTWVRDSGDRRVLAYVDLERTGAGRQFVAAGSPLLEPLLQGAARRVGHPGDTASVWGRWQRGTSAGHVVPPGTSSEARAFGELAGIPSVSISFDSLEGVRTTAYDTYLYVARFGDPDFRAQAAAADLAAAMGRLVADDGVASLSVGRLGETGLAVMDTLQPAMVGAAVQAATRVREGFARLRAAGTRRGAWEDGMAEPLARLSSLMLGVDAETGAGQWLPHVRHAMARSDREGVQRALTQLHEALDAIPLPRSANRSAYRPRGGP